MTQKQPDALRIANAIDEVFNGWVTEAATELRRLHEVNAELINQLDTIALFADGLNDECNLIAKRARTAIAKAENGAA